MRRKDLCHPFILRGRRQAIRGCVFLVSLRLEIQTLSHQPFSDHYQQFWRCERLPWTPPLLYLPTHPVLPYKTGGKLLFPICRICAEQRNLGSDDRCQHTYSEHSMAGTWVTSEVHDYNTLPTVINVKHC
jgi:hypothetical protein